MRRIPSTMCQWLGPDEGNTLYAPKGCGECNIDSPPVSRVCSNNEAIAMLAATTYCFI